MISIFVKAQRITVALYTLEYAKNNLGSVQGRNDNYKHIEPHTCHSHVTEQDHWQQLHPLVQIVL